MASTQTMHSKHRRDSTCSVSPIHGTRYSKEDVAAASLYFFSIPTPVEPPALATPPPPRTTHYWTSDSTRRQEYAAIDAASRGFGGWIRRHVLPSCLAGAKHISFDDDSGSVRRYRIELDDDDYEGSCEKRFSAMVRPSRRGFLAKLSEKRRTF